MDISHHRTPSAISLLAFVALVAFLLNSACEATGAEPARKDASPAPIDGRMIMKDLANKAVFFQHESVGENILDGIRDLMRENPELKIAIGDSLGTAGTAEMRLIDARLGRNGDAFAKIDNFRSLLDGGLGQNVNVAFLKLCYLDITSGTDIDKLFGYYTDTMNALQKMYPDILFLHLTVPLTRTDTTWKTGIKKWVGVGSLWEYGDNIARGKYNDLLRNAYRDSGVLFDLANFESTGSDGRTAYFQYKGASYQSLAPEYTEDGGHLNKEGRRMMARELLQFLGSH